MSTLQDVLDAAKQLNSADRMRLVAAIWDDLSPEEWIPPSDEWIAEAQRRSAEFEAGRMLASSWEDVRNRARNQAGLDG